MTGLTRFLSGVGALLAGATLVALVTLLAWAWVRLTGPLLRFLPLARRVRYASEPVPAAWRAIVERNVPLVLRLPHEARERLLRLAQVFVRDVPMEGLSGLDLTDEMKVTIAAQACLLVLNLRYPWFPTLRRVLVYPETFAPERVLFWHDSGIQRPPMPTAGEAWGHGTVILAWDNVRLSSAGAADGYNVVLHEFAHILDSEDGVMGGVPLLEPPSSPRTWDRVLAETFERQRRLVEEGREALLRDYGSTNRAEFFAVATEAFFEQPAHLKTAAPEWYEELRKFYRQDPAAW